MSESVKIAPSILSANFLELGRDLESISNADFVHFDVMDGNFVPNLSFGIPVLKQVKAATDLTVDVHLMIDNPDSMV
ncbi:MAG: ribulose-phosphate 3-epimerase, partial [Atopobiaceae bacterium]|nr:ribulose-phosphate 3-epimerase [Atopobiaceae bacterium]